MKKLILYAVSALSVCAVLGISSLSAQVNHKLVVSVPFDFTVIDQHLSAGKYSLSETPERVLLIRSEQGGAAKLFIAFSAEANKAQDHSKLVFRRYGEQYFLSQIWYEGSDQGRELKVSKAEQEIARYTPRSEEVAVLITGSKHRKPVP